MKLFGGKADTLMELRAAGFPIPPFAALESHWMQGHLAQCSLQGEPNAGWCQRILATPPSTSLQRAIEGRLPPGERFAVRSSALGEDSVSHSFAGQFTSVLNVPRNQVTRAVLEVWSSAFSSHVLAYRARSRLPAECLLMGVVIQQMLEPEVSGVAFAINPVTGSRRQVTIAAVYGLGEGLVSGDLDSDRFTVYADNTIEQAIADKTHCWAPGATGTSRRVPVAEPLRYQACLRPRQARDIAELARTLSEILGCWQDIEWCLRDGKLWLLQSRPITNLNQLPDPEVREAIWDNANIVESYPGITTPLTFSFVRDLYSRVYRRFAAMMGVERKLIERNRDTFEMLGFFNGRIYYNLLNWYRILSLLPGYRVNAGFMEQMMGVEKNFTVPPPPVPVNGNHRIRLAISLAGIIHGWWTLPRESRRFFQRVERELSIFRQTDLDELALDDLLAVYRRLEDRLLAHWKAPLVNDFFAMIFFGALRKGIDAWCPHLGDGFQNDLLTAERNIVSTEPPLRLAELADDCRRHPDMVAAAARNDAKALFRLIEKEPALYKAFCRLRERFGARSLEELKLETVTASQDPALLAAQLIPYITRSPADFRPPDAGGRRGNADSAFRRALGRGWRRLAGTWLLKHTRRLVSARENLRLERTRVFDAARGIFLAMGKRLAMERVIANPRDIFWLTREEIFDYIQGTGIAPDLGHLVSQRRQLWDTYTDASPPDRFHTRGCPGFAGPHQWLSQVPENSAGPIDGELCGTGCCQGVVSGEVVVVTDPRQCVDLEGKILVARQTDPGWAPLFPLASGLLVERGSLLSHSAIVAREMGIPAVVAIKGLLANLSTGDRVTLDGSTGRIRIHTPAESGCHPFTAADPAHTNTTGEAA